MIIVYDSVTGLGKKFARSLGYPSQSVRDPLREDCILVTRNVSAGKIPWSTKRFIKKNQGWIKGFVVNGDSVRFPKTFCGASLLIIEKYGLTHIRNIEGAGTIQDQEVVRHFIQTKFS